MSVDVSTPAGYWAACQAANPTFSRFVLAGPSGLVDYADGTAAFSRQPATAIDPYIGQYAADLSGPLPQVTQADALVRLQICVSDAIIPCDNLENSIGITPSSDAGSYNRMTASWIQYPQASGTLKDTGWHIYAGLLNSATARNQLYIDGALAVETGWDFGVYDIHAGNYALGGSARYSATGQGHLAVSAMASTTQGFAAISRYTQAYTARLTSAPEVTLFYGEPNTYQVQTSLPNPTGYSATHLPTGMSIHPTTGAITGSPTDIDGQLTGIVVTSADRSLTVQVRFHLTCVDAQPEHGTFELNTGNTAPSWVSALCMFTLAPSGLPRDVVANADVFYNTHDSSGAGVNRFEDTLENEPPGFPVLTSGQPMPSFTWVMRVRGCAVYPRPGFLSILDYGSGGAPLISLSKSLDTGGLTGNFNRYASSFDGGLPFADSADLMLEWNASARTITVTRGPTQIDAQVTDVDIIASFTGAGPVITRLPWNISQSLPVADFSGLFNRVLTPWEKDAFWLAPYRAVRPILTPATGLTIECVDEAATGDTINLILTPTGGPLPRNSTLSVVDAQGMSQTSGAIPRAGGIVQITAPMLTGGNVLTPGPVAGLTHPPLPISVYPGVFALPGQHPYVAGGTQTASAVAIAAHATRYQHVYEPSESVVISFTGQVTHCHVLDTDGAVVVSHAAASGAFLTSPRTFSPLPAGDYRLRFFRDDLTNCPTGSAVGTLNFVVIPPDDNLLTYPDMPSAAGRNGLPNLAAAASAGGDSVQMRALAGGMCNRFKVEDDSVFADFIPALTAERDIIQAHEPAGLKPTPIFSWPDGIHDLDKFETFVRAALAFGIKPIIETYNEPSNAGSPYNGSGAAFAAYLAPIYARTKQIDPTLIVIGPSLVSGASSGSFGWQADFFNAGGGACIDAYALHTYGTPNGSIKVGNDNFGALHAFLSSHGVGSLPWYQTEQGQPTQIYGLYSNNYGIGPASLHDLLLERWGCARQHNCDWRAGFEGFGDFQYYMALGFNVFAGLPMYRARGSELFGKVILGNYDFGEYQNDIIGSRFGAADGSGAQVAWLQTDGLEIVAPFAVQGMTTGTLTVRLWDGNLTTFAIANGRVFLPLAFEPIYVRLPDGVTIASALPALGTNFVTGSTVTASSGANAAMLSDGNLHPTTALESGGTTPGFVGRNLPTGYETLDFALGSQKTFNHVRVKCPWAYLAIGGQTQGHILRYDLYARIAGAWTRIAQAQPEARVLLARAELASSTDCDDYSYRVSARSFTLDAPVTADAFRIVCKTATFAGSTLDAVRQRVPYSYDTATAQISNVGLYMVDQTGAQPPPPTDPPPSVTISIFAALEQLFTVVLNSVVTPQNQ